MIAAGTIAFHDGGWKSWAIYLGLSIAANVSGYVEGSAHR